MHVKRIIRFLEEQFREGKRADLILLPELSTIDYSRPAFDNLPELAEPLAGETFEEMAALAQRLGCAVSYGFPRVEDGHYTISQLVVGSSGQYLAHYDKIHLAQFGASAEKAYFTPGRRLGIFELAGLRLGILICYDFRFPELTRLMVNEGQLDVILHPVAFTRDGTYESWFHFVVTRALENQVYFVSVNRAGPEWGGSVFCPPWIDSRTKPVVMGQGEEARVFTVDRTIINAIRAQYPYGQDSLADYSILRPGKKERES